MNNIKRILFLIYLLSAFPVTQLRSQRIDVDVFMGMSNYQGDLQPLIFTVKNSHAAFGAIAKFALDEHFFIRSGYSYGNVAGSDKDNKNELKYRNLSFQTKIHEFSLGLEYRLLSKESSKVTPYFFAGVGVFKFNPYTTDRNGNTVYLQPLGTEGQGLAEYPEKKPYKLTQISIPYGLGIKYYMSDLVNIGAEFRHTYAFSDYLDDVSGFYADYNALLNNRGLETVQLAFRSDEIFPNRVYPNEGIRRGNPKLKDWYYFLGVTLGLAINNGNGESIFGKIFSNSFGGNGAGSKAERRRILKQVKCY
ncbi:DUF6089 family protein [Polluticaenibacter yanchengensis]|uniref:DUF6089 family protein n=1 Tax=Polluticaenibacter yanchengensis TaxID=3014562 RepID=A0ABT4ULD9_9BACT|nr:DUF6089 family protein [Chitinophagaceae bacterium LY-5]